MRALEDFGAENGKDLLDLVSWGQSEAVVRLHNDGTPKLGTVRVLDDQDAGEYLSIAYEGLGSATNLKWRPVPLMLRLSPSSIAKASSSADDKPALDPTGAHAGAVLDAMSRRQIDEVGERMRAVVPDVEEVWAARKKVNGQLGHEPTFMIDGHQVKARHASEGTVLVFGIVLAMLSVPRQTVVLLDDLQRGLHPSAQAEVVAALRRMLSENPTLQIIATTHSPYLVDQLETDEVAVVIRRNGRTNVRRLADHPDAERWKGELRTGEFWSAVGEDWVVDP